MDAQPNRRRHPRFAAPGLTARIRFGTMDAPCDVENISLGGTFVRTSHLHHVGRDVVLTLLRPGWQALSVRAKVSCRVDSESDRPNRRTPGMGLSYVGLDEPAQERIRTLVRDLVAQRVRASSGPPPPPPGEFVVEQAPLWKQTELVHSHPPPSGVVSLPGPPPSPVIASESERLLTQIRGLLRDLAERDAEIARLRKELERLQLQALGQSLDAAPDAC